MDKKLCDYKILNLMTKTKLCSCGLSNKEVIMYPISGPLLMVKAEKFARKLKYEELMCSTGWSDRFKLCHNITFSEVSDEARNVKSKTSVEWFISVEPNVRGEYGVCDIFNTNETWIYFRLALKFNVLAANYLRTKME